MSSLKGFYSVKEAAELCGISYMALHQRIHRGTIPFKRVGGSVVLIHERDFNEIRRGKNKQSTLPWNNDDPTRDSTHPLYKCYYNMIRRCYVPAHRSYHRYGERGIRVCDRWLNSFADFVKDIGMPPTSKHSLDRYPDNEGNYEPGNTRWATASEQNNNRGKK